MRLLLTIVFSVIISPVFATDWYVDNTNTGTTNGTTSVMVGHGQGGYEIPYLAIGCWTHGGTPGLEDDDHQPNSGWFYGYMDDLRIYDRVLTTNEIWQLYNLSQPEGDGTPDPTPGVSHPRLSRRFRFVPTGL